MSALPPVVEMTDPRPHSALPDADWADRFCVRPSRPMTAEDALSRMTSNAPGWITSLMNARNAIGAKVGLKSASLDGFPVLSRRPDQIVLGFDDSHLNFRLVLDVIADDEATPLIALSTLVRRHNLLGRAYILVVTPFHRLIVRRLLRRLQL